MMRLADLSSLRVAIWGAGREGRAAYHLLRKQNVTQTLTIICKRAEREAVASWMDDRTDLLDDEDAAVGLLQFDVVIKSPGISLYRSDLQDARAQGVKFVSGTTLWFAEHPNAKTIVVSGTKGKSTTSALIAHLLRAAGKRVVLAGNIGMPLLEQFDLQPEPDWWVLELSSFQLADLIASPDIAVMLNIYPEHLDWHGDFARYARDKLRLLGDVDLQPKHVVVAAQLKLPEGIAMPHLAATFGRDDGFHVRADGIAFGQRKVLDRSHLQLPGAHNLLNVCAALTAVMQTGVDAMAVAESVTRFQSLPHRLQHLGSRGGVEFVNDSIATTPHASEAAVRCFPNRDIVLILGGFDRGVPWDEFAGFAAAHRIHTMVLQGQNAARIEQALQSTHVGVTSNQMATALIRSDSFELAVQQAIASCPSGGVVLLSPGAPSFGQFQDYAERGRRFALLCGFDADQITSIEGMGV